MPLIICICLTLTGWFAGARLVEKGLGALRGMGDSILGLGLTKARQHSETWPPKYLKNNYTEIITTSFSH